MVYIRSDTFRTCQCFNFPVSVPRLDEDWQIQSLSELDVPIDHGKGNETLYIYKNTYTVYLTTCHCIHVLQRQRLVVRFIIRV